MHNILKIFAIPLAAISASLQAAQAGENNAISELPFLAEDEVPTDLNAARNGKPVYILFYPAWCFYYTEETDPEFAQDCNRSRELMLSLHETYDDDVYFLNLLSHIDSSFRVVNLYKENFQIPFALGYDDNGLWMQTLRVRDFPTHFFIDAGGQLVERKTGTVEELEATLKELIETRN